MQLRKGNPHRKDTEDAHAQQVAWKRGDSSRGSSHIGSALLRGADDSAEGFAAMKELEKDTFSASSRTRETRASWWVSRAKARGIQPFPLDVQKLTLLGGLAQEGWIPERHDLRLRCQADSR